MSQHRAARGRQSPGSSRPHRSAPTAGLLFVEHLVSSSEMGPLPLLVAVVAVLGTSSAQTSPPEVSVGAGRVRGRWLQTESGGRPIAAFEGIPFAEPPVGELRFQAPQPAKPWTGVKVADRPGAICLQRNFFLQSVEIEGSEDCLFVNVYAPETVSRTSPLPVMVYVHGGGFLSGSGHIYEPGHLLEQDVVLVTFNYRLGPLGFLSTADDVIPGNYGLKDMVLALQWVRENVGAFGGDPGRVTIFGESAGGAAVHYLMLSPLSRGLFHGVAAMSGTALGPWAYQGAEASKERAAKVSQVLGCPAGCSRALAECLAGKTGAEITGVDVAFMEWLAHPMVPFRPTAEPSGPGAFIDRSPAELLAAGDVADVPFMTGVTSHEGCIGVVPVLESPALTKELNDKFDSLGPVIFFAKHLPESVNKKIFAQVREAYFGDRAIGNETRLEFMDMFTDSFFTYSALEATRLQLKAAKSPAYFYEVAHDSDRRSFAVPFGAKEPNYGVCHADDLLYLFPLKSLVQQEPSEADKAFTAHLVEVFTTFARTGSPTTDGSWPAVRDAAAARIEYALLDEAVPRGAGVQVRRGRGARYLERAAMWERQPVNLAMMQGDRAAAKDEL